jgi:transposase
VKIDPIAAVSNDAPRHSSQLDAVAMALPAVRSRGRIEIDIAGARIRVESGVDQATGYGAGGGAGRQVISFRADLKIMLAAQPVDFRKSVHTLSALVSEALRADPYCGDVFIFRSKRSDRVKLLAWDGSGMVLVTKWLEEGRFTWPPIRDGVVALTATQLSMLIDGLDWTRVTPKVVKRPVGMM